MLARSGKPVFGAGGQEGFSLLEALIALVIIMIGLLGVAGLQALGVRSSAQAHMNTVASLNAHSLAASMRTNRVYWTDSTTPAAITIKASAPGTVSVTPTIVSANCETMQCSPQQLAGYSLKQWGKQLADMQRDAKATITRIANAGSSAYAYKVEVYWNQRRMKGQGVQAASAATRSTAVVVQP